MQTRDAKPLLGDEKLTRIAAQFATEPETSRQALRAWRDEDPPGFTGVAVRQLGRDPNGPATPALSLLLSRDGLYLHFLSDPAELTHQEAVNAARVLAARDKRFYVKLTEFAGDSLSDDQVTRVLQIAEALGAAGMLVPWLRRLTRHADGYIRQKAVMIMCQAGSNPMLVERQLHSPDARVRANAVESLWSVCTPAAHVLLEYASRDPHHRVAVNALVGLFLHGDRSALERINDQTHHNAPAFRIAAAWALGMTGKPEAWPALDALRNDPVPQVRESALRALEKVPEPRLAPQPKAPAPERPRREVAPHQPEAPAELDLLTPQFRLVR
jgi:HEAT repeat protein